MIALGAAAVITPALAAAGRKMGLVDHPGDLKVHRHPTPVTGGLGVIVALLITGAWFAGLRPVIIAAVLLAFAGGSLDDVRPSPPWLRLIFQAGAGALLVAGGLTFEPLGHLGPVALLLATVASCNAVNMVDGQDGLAGGLIAIAALGMAVIAASVGLAAGLPLALAGASVGFLLWNRPPARVFLGDGGAYAAGVLLVVIVARLSFGGWSTFLGSCACLGVFIFEIVSTVARRLRSSAAATRGDRGHSYDRLTQRWGSRAASTLTMWGAGVCVMILGIGVVRMAPAAGVGLIAASASVIAILDVRIPATSMQEGDP